MVFSSALNNKAQKQQELTPWDLFVCVAGRPEGIALTRLAHILQVERERSLIRPLGELAEQGLILDQGDRYQLASNKKAQNLKMTFDYALAYNYDYNAFMSADMVDFLTTAYRHEYFTQYDVPREKLYPEVIARLIRNKMLIVYEFKPFRGKLVENPFLDGLCEFLNLRRSNTFFSGLFRKKAPLEQVIKTKIANAASSPEAANCKKMLGDDLLKRDFCSLTAGEQAIKSSVMREDTEMFDQSSTGCYKKAWEQMHDNVAKGVKLNVEVIQQYHSLAMASTDLGGKIRDFEVVIRNNPHFKTAPFKNVPMLLDKLIYDIYSVELSDISDKFDLASFVYNQFIYIHPFEDGNSRLARILLAHMLNENKFPFEEIPSSYEVRFLQATKGYKKRDDNVLKEMLEEIYINHLNLQEMEQALTYQPPAEAERAEQVKRINSVKPPQH